jgi:hypothetical protein
MHRPGVKHAETLSARSRLKLQLSSSPPQDNPSTLEPQLLIHLYVPVQEHIHFFSIV